MHHHWATEQLLRLFRLYKGSLPSNCQRRRLYIGPSWPVSFESRRRYYTLGREAQSWTRAAIAASTTRPPLSMLSAELRRPSTARTFFTPTIASRPTFFPFAVILDENPQAGQHFKRANISKAAGSHSHFSPPSASSSYSPASTLIPVVLLHPTPRCPLSLCSRSRYPIMSIYTRTPCTSSIPVA